MEPKETPPDSNTPLGGYTCDEAFRRLNDYLDRELTPSEMQCVRAHLRVCVICAAEFTFEASVLSEVRASLRSLEAPEDLLVRVARALKQVKNRPDG